MSTSSINKTEERGVTKMHWLQSVNFRLKFSVFLTLISLLFLAYEGVSGMKNAANAIEDMYSMGMQHTIRSGRVLDNLGSARSSLLLSFQHDPASSFSDMHDHSINKHIEDVERYIAELHNIIDNEILSSELTQEELSQVNQLATELDKVTEQGFEPAIKAMKNKEFNKANLILLKQINPSFKVIKKEAQAFLNMQVEEGKENFEQTNENISSFILLVSVTVFICLLLIVSLSILIIKRINDSSMQLQITADKIATGNLTQRVAVTGADEFTFIALSVNKIVESFQHVVQTTHQSTTQLTQSAEENATVANQTTQNIMEQQQQTQMIATAIHQFTATVHDVAQSASSASQASEQADVSAEQGQKIVQDSINMIVNLATEMQDSVQSMKELAQHAEDIGGVVDVIQSISEQTNLLALNAAIEAARAGEQGRGFAVVADEVRTLASRTQQSTKEILQTIQTLQQGSRDVTSRLVDGAENAQKTADEAKKAGDALVEITASVDEISAMNAQIATAAEQQSSVTEEINRNITAISDISNQTAAGAEQTNAATEELAKLSETLRSEIARYQV
ncbi:MAG: methyl-accepting chemotaxis protein [Psychromonas sp.]|nr:methyl-accepting chemotaxis protein [Psychromonas sp.]